MLINKMMKEFNKTVLHPQANLNLFKLNLDRGATYLFPFLFFCFNCCYWTVYLGIMPRYLQDRFKDKEESN